MTKETRLQIMLAIRASHDEEYYKMAVKSNGIDESQLTHIEVSAFKASMDAIEADIFYDVCENQPKTDIESYDLTKLEAKPDSLT